MIPPLPLPGPRPKVKIHPQRLQDRARTFVENAELLRDTLHNGQQVLTRLKDEGLGWDETSRPFSIPFWERQGRVLEALKDTVAVLNEIHLGLTMVARGIAGADAATAETFRRLRRPAEVDPYADLDYSRLRPENTR